MIDVGFKLKDLIKWEIGGLNHMLTQGSCPYLCGVSKMENDRNTVRSFLLATEKKSLI